MKQIKIVLMAMLAVWMGVTVTSCLDSDNGRRQYEDYVTITGGFYGAPTLTGDAYGYTYVASNVDILKKKDGDYLERAYIVYELADGEQIVEGKNSYNIVIVGGIDLLGKSFCNPDTLSYNGVTPLYPLSSIDGGLFAWPSSRYINVTFGHAYETKSDNKTIPDLFDLYIEDVEESTVYVRLNQNQEIDTNYSTSTTSNTLSFRLPSKFDLNEWSPVYLENDSLDFIIKADGTSEQELKTKKPVRAKIAY